MIQTYVDTVHCDLKCRHGAQTIDECVLLCVSEDYTSESSALWGQRKLR